MKKIILFIGVVFMFYSCAKDDYACEAGNPKIVGATCSDGSASSATGSGACSSHGGVKTWRCRD